MELDVVTAQNPSEVVETLDLRPSKILGIGANYKAHAAEMGKTVPDEPLVFMKAPSALLATGADIERPRGYERVDFEGELGVVIGRPARRVSAADALDYVLGYVCVNDVTVRDLQKRDNQWTRAKGFDTFCPVGPRIVSGLDASDLHLVTRVNGTVRQDSRTSDMAFDVPALIAHISAVMTLERGDLITTGTPSGVGPVVAGDEISIDIEGIGTLTNRVIDAPA